jgi:hypothetical protein
VVSPVVLPALTPLTYTWNPPVEAVYTNATWYHTPVDGV